jgi:hypothetical protein
LEFLAYEWVNAATATLSWQEPVFVSPGPNPKLNWPALAKQVDSLLAEGQASTDDILRYWVLDLAFMMLPEVTNLGSSVLNHFIHQPRVIDLWDALADEMRSYRIRVLYSQFVGIGLVDLANRLGDIVPDGLSQRLRVRFVAIKNVDGSLSYVDAESADVD